MKQNNFSIDLIKTYKIEVNDKSHCLPPYKGKIEEFKVSDYHCPEEWSKDGIFIRVEENQPLWFDFRNNWDCAVICSIQKVNPVTGERIDIEKGLLKDPKQNYLRLPEQMWLDGYVNDGKVYQFIITKSGLKIAVNEYVLPEYEQDSHAIAFAFFNAKKPKERNSGVSEYLKTVKSSGQHTNCVRSRYDLNDLYKNTNTIDGRFEKTVYGLGGTANPIWFSPLHTPQHWKIKNSNHDEIEYASACSGIDISDEANCCGLDSDESIITHHNVDFVEEEKTFEKVSMAAGGRIVQPIVQDDNTVDYYEEKPSAILKIYFAFPEQFSYIMNKGKIQNAEKKDKFVNSGLIAGMQIPLVK